MEDELVKPDPWYVRLEIANEHERIATAIMAVATKAQGNDKEPTEAIAALRAVAMMFDARASALRGQLGREADAQARAEEDRDRPHRQAYGWTP